MKAFLVFSYYTYYPSGGLGDVMGDFDTLEEAQTFVRDVCTTSDYVYIWNRITLERWDIR